MDERMQFVADYLKDQWPVAQLCREYGISRETGYKWIDRYEAEGGPGMREPSRAPHTHPCLTPVAIQERRVQVRLQRPHWGPLANCSIAWPPWSRGPPGRPRVPPARF